jgi:hypothetical protein
MRNIYLLFWTLILFAGLGNTSAAYGQDAPRQRGVVDVSPDTKSSLSIGPYYALVIGNNDYTYLNKLQTAVNDATALGQLLQERYGFQTKLLKNATRNDVITALNEYRKTLAPNSNLLIYYAGHGYQDNDAKKAYWLPVNAQSDNNENWISADDITTNVRALPSLHVLIVSDSCYSGALLTRSVDRNINLGLPAVFIAKMLRSKSRTLMASGGNEPVADGGAGSHSVFAGAILQSLEQIQDAQFTAQALFGKVQVGVAVRQAAQVPQYTPILLSGDEGGDFVFSRGGAGPLAGDSGDMDAVAISDVIQGYQDAYNQRDAAALWQVWPAAPAKTRRAIEQSFAQAASIQMMVRFDAPEVKDNHEDAVAKGQFTQVFTPKNAKPQPEVKGPIVFELKKTDGKWTISDVK